MLFVGNFNDLQTIWLSYCIVNSLHLNCSCLEKDPSNFTYIFAEALQTSEVSPKLSKDQEKDDGAASDKKTKKEKKEKKGNRNNLRKKEFHEIE